MKSTETLAEYLARKQVEAKVSLEGTVDDNGDIIGSSIEAIDFLSSSYDIAEKRTSIIFIPFILAWNFFKGIVMGIITVLSGGMVLYGSTLKTPLGRQLDDMSIIDAFTTKGTKRFLEDVYDASNSNKK